MILLRYTFIEKSLSYLGRNSYYTSFDIENTVIFRNNVSSKFNNFDITIAHIHLFLSYAAIQSNFDIDSCNFDIDHDIGLETENDVTCIIYGVKNSLCNSSKGLPQILSHNAKINCDVSFSNGNQT